ncbi:unknown [Brachyspira sp. CAG:484]|nr:unknown [Brachyspira sp. CAG:484]
MQKRWYDVEPVLSRAIAMLEEADEDLQVVCAEYVIDKLKDIDFEMSLDEQYNYILRRWYDKNIKVSHAMEYLKHAPDELRTELALDIIEHIEKNTEK